MRQVPITGPGTVPVSQAVIFTDSPGTHAGTVDLDFAVRGYVRDAIEKYRLSETYWFSVTGTVLPSHPVPVPAFIVTLYCRDPGIIGAYLSTGAVQTGFPTREELTKAVTTLIENLRVSTSNRLKREY